MPCEDISKATWKVGKPRKQLLFICKAQGCSLGTPHSGAVETNPTSIHEDGGSIPGLGISTGCGCDQTKKKKAACHGQWDQIDLASRPPPLDNCETQFFDVTKFQFTHLYYKENNFLQQIVLLIISINSI